MAMMAESDGFYGITKFSGDDNSHSSSKWAQDIEDNAEIFGWTAQQKLVIARRSLTGTAELWLRTEKVAKTYEELKAAVQKEFPDAVNSKEMHEIMTARKKRRDESFYQYMLVMKEMGKRAKFPDYVAIQYIIDGIIDTEVNKTILYGATTYPVLKEKLTLYEKMKMNAGKHEEIPRKHQNMKFSAVQTPSRRCYKCGEANHLAITCPNGMKCFRCNKYGHIGQQCTSGDVEGAAGPSVKRYHTARSQPMRQRNDLPIKQFGQSEGSQRAAMFGLSMEANPENGASGHDGEMSSEFDSDNVVQIVNKPDAEIVNNKPIKLVNLCNKTVNALIDSGSDLNLISSVCYEQLGVCKREDDTVLSGLGRFEVRSSGKFCANVDIDGQCYKDVLFHVVPNECMPFCVILGQEFLKDVVMVMREGSVLLFRQDEEWMMRVNCCVSKLNVTDNIQTSNAEIKSTVLRLVEDYQPKQIREAPLQLRIILKDDKPVAQRPRRLSLVEQNIVEEQVKEWLEKKIIQVSFSEYASPLVLVKKKDGSTRVCVDYRLLNKKIYKDEFPLPVIDDFIDKLKDAAVFSVLDLKNGFFHVKVSEESIPYTSFVTHQGQYEFLRAPFGLSVSPKCFMRYVTIIFRELIAKNMMMIFVDDIIIPAEDEEEAVERLTTVLDVASQYGLEINWKKAILISREIEYLGHVIKRGEIRPSPHKVDAVARYPQPMNVKQVMSFIGLTSYFRKYIKDYAKIARPLTELLKQDNEFIFGPEQQQAFCILKNKLTSDPVLKIYNPKLKTELHTDASSQALAAILLQRHCDGQLCPVQYMSKKTNDAESRYSSYELEALAIVQGVKKFRQYLYGIHFKIVTDCKAFELTLKKKELPPKVARWALLLDEYDYEIEHRAGTKMQHTDALSRNPYVAVISLHDEIHIAQEADDELNAIIQVIIKEGQYKDYWIDAGILYKGDQKQIVVPRSLEKEILRKVHQKGHFSVRKMKEAIDKDYYIRNRDKQINEVVASCIPCLLATRKEGKQEGYLNPIINEGTPLHTLHLDHVGPLTETRKLYNYILTMIDSFTKFVWLFPTKSTSSAETLSKLQLHQQTFGNPTRIITDRGTAFTSNDFGKYCEDEGIEHIKITTGVPRGNGQVERVHRILIPMLTKLCIADQSLWYKHVSRVQRALNSTHQRSINTTPYELFVGTKMKSKEDLEIMSILQQETINQYNDDRDELRIRAKEQIQKIQAENKSQYDKKRKASTTYVDGDIVAIKRTQFGVGLKLKPKYFGPYKVIKVKRNDRYDVEKLYGGTEGPLRTSTSADYMKKWPSEDLE